MQSRLTTDRTAIRSSSRTFTGSGDISQSAAFSRYRLLDDEEQRREVRAPVVTQTLCKDCSRYDFTQTEAVERIIRGLKAQRRSKVGASRHANTITHQGDSTSRRESRRGSTSHTAPEDAFRPEVSASPTMKTRQAQSTYSRDLARHASTRHETPLDSPELTAKNQGGQDSSTSFQTQVIEELRRLKEVDDVVCHCSVDPATHHFAYPRHRLSGVTWQRLKR
jgi:hypothetical protein